MVQSPPWINSQGRSNTAEYGRLDPRSQSHFHVCCADDLKNHWTYGLQEGLDHAYKSDMAKNWNDRRVESVDNASLRQTHKATARWVSYLFSPSGKCSFISVSPVVQRIE